jgi:hypothetical protein
MSKAKTNTKPWEVAPSAELVAKVEDAANLKFAAEKAIEDAKQAHLIVREGIADTFDMPVETWSKYLYSPASEPIDNDHIPIYNFSLDLACMISAPTCHDEIKTFTRDEDTDSKAKIAFEVIDKIASRKAGELVYVNSTPKTKRQWVSWRHTQMKNMRDDICGKSRKTSVPKTWEQKTQTKFNSLWNALNAEDAPKTFNQSTAIKTLNQIATIGKFEIPS